MPKQPKVTSVAEALEQHSKCVAAEEAVQRALQLELYRHVETEIRARFPSGHFDFSDEFQRQNILRQDFLEEVAERYRKAGWDATFSNHESPPSILICSTIKFSLKPKKGRVTKKK